MAVTKKPRSNKAGVEPSVRTFTTWSPGLILAAELQADSGNLRQAAALCDWLLGDDRLPSTLSTRVQALLGLDPTFEASGDKRRSNRVVRALEGQEDWWAAYPEQELAQLHTWGLLLGVAPARHSWEVSEDHGGRILPRPAFWHPQHLRLDQQSREWKIRVAQAGTFGSGSEETLDPGDGTWLLHTPYGNNRPWSMGLWRGLSRWALLKYFAIQDWARHGEKGATLAATHDKDVKSTKEQRAQLANDIYARGREAVVVLPAGFDLKLVEATANTKQIYEAQIRMADEAIAVAVRGGNLTTVMSQGAGSRAAAETQERTGDHAKLKFDAQSLTTTIHDQSLVWWAEFNFGDRKLAPWPVYPVEEEEDLKSKVEGEEKAFLVVDAAERLGFEVDRKLFLEEHRITWAKPGEAPVPPKPAGQPIAMPGAKPFPSLDPGKAEPPKAQLVARLASGFLTANASGFLNGQLATDAIVDSYSAAAIVELEETLEAVLSELDAAVDYDDLRARLRARYESLDPEALSELVRKAMILGELAGRAAVNEDT